MHRTLHTCLAAVAAAALFCGAAQAGNVNIPPGHAGAGKLTVGVGVICDTTGEAEHYVRLRATGTGVRPAMQRVNATAQNPQACGLAAIAFKRDKTMDTQSVRGKLMSIVRINVVGGFDGHHWKTVQPMVQYAVMQAKGIEI